MQLIIRLLFTAFMLLTVSAAASARQRVLVLAELGGQHGAFTEAGLRWLRQKGREMDFDVTEVNDCHRIAADSVFAYDLIVQLNYPPYAWSDASARDFERAVDEGRVAWVGFHHASLLGEFDGYQMWQWFSDFLGGIRFQNYIAEKADALMTVEDRQHPVMAGVSPKFIVREDEWYTYDRSPRPNVHVLASVDESTYTPMSRIRMGDHPVVWTNPRKAARNVYFQIGHSASLFDNAEFVRMFTNALCWGLRRPMPLDRAHALETEMQQRWPDRTETLPLAEGWRHEGLGRLDTAADGATLRLSMPLETGRRAQGSPDDPDYCIYGTLTARLPLGGRNLEQFDRLAFDVRTDLDRGIANLNLVLENHPASQLGAHLVNIDLGESWQHVVYEVADLPRNHVGALRIYTDLKGRNLSHLDTIHYYIRNLRLEHVGHTEQTRGWMPPQGRLAYSHAGYYPEGTKRAIAAWQPEPKPFRLVDMLTGETVFSGQSVPVATSIGPFTTLDFTACHREGLYTLQFDGLSTEPFRIDRAALSATAWPVLSFVGAQRCGVSVAGIHGDCHVDVFAEHDGRMLSYGGGWHDAGDLSQQTLQTGDVAFALLEAYDALRAVDAPLASGLRDEARHGLAQLLRTRFGDGYRASSIGLLHWTDGRVGTPDDITTVRRQNLGFDNFLCAAYEAYGALLLGDDSLRRAAVDDFTFARRQFERGGVDTFLITMEHSYNTSACTFMAAASWSASMLYRLTGRKQYARLAARYMDYTLSCQQREGAYAGYFCRDATLQVPVHFIHQSREQLPMQALVALCQSQPDHRQRPQWESAIRLYADYLKAVMPATAPYDMAPSGVYHAREYDSDPDGFSRLHLWAPDDAPQRFDRQTAAGQPLGDGRSLRRFPVWFSIFNGNEAILLSTGKAAALAGRYLGDAAMLDIARQQLYWTVGQNPFCQSLIYGVGHRYPSLDSFSSGELTGAMPVGIRSAGDADEPYWPTTNNACYKEVWLTSAGKWLSLLAEMAMER